MAQQPFMDQQNSSDSPVVSSFIIKPVGSSWTSWTKTQYEKEITVDNTSSRCRGIPFTLSKIDSSFPSGNVIALASPASREGYMRTADTATEKLRANYEYWLHESTILFAATNHHSFNAFVQEC